jgi:uncharacterized protein (DUF1697 family)
MATYLGFLRAINLGANRKFPKADIVAATEAAGFRDVATHINTGNIRFDTTLRARARIEAALEAAYLADRGFEVQTMVFSPEEVCAIADEAEELAAGYEGPHYVSLLKHTPDAARIEQIEALGSDGERVHVRGRAVHLLLAEQYHRARVTNAAVEKLLGPATNRNLKVIRALAEKWC